MKRKMLVFVSVLCMVAALMIGVVVPAMADDNGTGEPDLGNQAITMSKEAVVSGTTVTCKVIIENHATNGQTLTIDSVVDTVYHFSSTDVVTIVPTIAYPIFTLDAFGFGPNYQKIITFSYELAFDDAGEIADTVTAAGYHTQPSGKHIVAGATESAVVKPVPELSAGFLFGLGVVGLGAFVLLRRREASARI